MSSPQPIDPPEDESKDEGDTPIEDKERMKNDDAATNSSSGRDSPLLTATATAATPAAAAAAQAATPPASGPAPFKYDPNKITLKFIFANRDGVNAMIECAPTDTIAEVKGALLSVWPEDLPQCSGGDKLRFICMGKGMLTPDTKTLASFDVPVFKTHPTPVNVAVKPESLDVDGGSKKKGSPKKNGARSPAGASAAGGAGGMGGAEPGTSGCSCIIM